MTKEELLSILDDNHVTASHIARKIGKDRSTVSHYLSGKLRIPDRVARDINLESNRLMNLARVQEEDRRLVRIARALGLDEKLGI